MNLGDAATRGSGTTKVSPFGPRRRGSDGVLLGHNRDDTFENLFANINRRQHYDELRGMTAISEERGVRRGVPLLAIDKSISTPPPLFRTPASRGLDGPDVPAGVFQG